jgi:hypothetical protein
MTQPGTRAIIRALLSSVGGMTGYGVQGVDHLARFSIMLSSAPPLPITETFVRVRTLTTRTRTKTGSLEILDPSLVSFSNYSSLVHS